MTITIGGKPIRSRAVETRVGKHRQLTTQQIAKRHPADPFPPIESFRAETVEYRVSVGGELQRWAEQKLDEMVPIAKDEMWLRLQLREPELQNHPLRPDAIKRLKGMDDQLAELASDVAYLEAHADRIWQSLDPEDREHLASKWVADVGDNRIILNAWKFIAQVGFSWPDNYSVKRRWFSCLAPPLIADMEQGGLVQGIPLGRQIDPFEVEDVEADMT